MKTSFPTRVLLGAAVSLSSVNAMVLPNHSAEFESFISTYNKTYVDAESKAKHFEIFQRTMELNGGQGFNYFSDLTTEGIEATVGKTIPPETVAAYREYVLGLEEYTEEDDDFLIGPVPESLDLRQVPGLVGPVKDQGPCGSCWAFGGMAAVEGFLGRRNGVYTSLSEQHLINCNQWGEGCEGAQPSHVWIHGRITQGIATTETCPYHAKREQCNWSGDIRKIPGHGQKRIMDWQTMKRVLANNRVVSVGINIFDLPRENEPFDYYRGGLFTGINTHTAEGMHAMAAVGYGHAEGREYILVKNSWNTWWGEEGYIRWETNAATQSGLFHIANVPTMGK